MPWNMQDYPNSMKNLAELERKKAIDIANALLANGYPDDRAIPIAMSQARKWYQDQDAKEKAKFRKEANPTKHDKHEQKGNPELIDANEIVKHQDDGWAVIAEGAKQASEIFSSKEEAVKRAREITKNKDSTLKIHRKDGSLETEVTPRK
ncbi:DUF2188 domain-containing protein [Loigolactobacillus zhaoyuanensis]|uniref:DUF2188 domain-containing protein n=1 Tax=Loigolactobacillus zhaoyuanensis TaxID=2486017 RepID=UPI000F7391B8|nr:DUF2188 domain-containing protein [Loigolactobacillus zhaoyuanensis]